MDRHRNAAPTIVHIKNSIMVSDARAFKQREAKSRKQQCAPGSCTAATIDKTRSIRCMNPDAALLYLGSRAVTSCAGVISCYWRRVVRGTCRHILREKTLRLHADPKGYELHAESLVGRVALGD